MASSAAILQGKVDQFEADVDRARQIVNGDASTVVDTEAGPVRSFANQIHSLNLVGAWRCDLKADMDLDLGHGPGTLAQVEQDPVAANNGIYVKAGASGTGSWSFLNQTAFTQLSATLQSLSGLQGNQLSALKQITRLGTLADFQYRCGYTSAPAAISNPSTRYAIVEDATGYGVTTLAAGTSPWPIAVKLPYDMVPGDTLVMECIITGGALGATGGPFFGVDPATTGALSSSARVNIWRNAAAAAGVYGSTSQGAADPTHDLTPAPSAQPATVALDTAMRWEVRVKAGRQYDLVITKAGVQAGFYSSVNALPAGAVVWGLLLPANATGKITRVERRGFYGDTVYVDGTVGASGNGMPFAAMKTPQEAVAAARTYGLPDCRIKILSKSCRGYFWLDGADFERFFISGMPGGQSEVIAADQNPTDWVLLAGTTRTYRRPNQVGPGMNVNLWSTQVYLTGVRQTSTMAPWVTFPDTIIPAASTDVTNMDGLTGGAIRVSGGFMYIRTPDGMDANPNTVAMEVNIATAVVNVVGSPYIEIDGIRGSRGGLYGFYGGYGRGVLRNCHFLWAAFNVFEDAAGSYEYVNCTGQYASNDVFARTFPAGYEADTSGRPISIIRGCRASHTLAGDGFTHHALDSVLKPSAILDDFWAHDIAKCGILPNNGDLYVRGARLERCRVGFQHSNSITGTNNTLTLDRLTIDGQGHGEYGILLQGYAGTKFNIALNDIWISSHSVVEIEGDFRTVAGQTNSPGDLTAVFTNIRCQSPMGTAKIRTDPQIAFTFQASNAITGPSP